MKKRSLFAAVAMLIVSAIVLTGSTYAWFSSAGVAYVQKAEATISVSDQSNIQVKTGSLAWGQTLTMQQLTSSNSPKQLQAVDFDPQTSTTAIKTLDYDGTYYTGITNGSLDNVLRYSWQVRAVNPGTKTTLNIPVEFAAGGDTPALIGVVQVVEQGDSGWYTYGNTSWKPLGSVTAATETAGTAGVIDDGDITNSGEALGSSKSASNLSGTISITGDTTHPLTDGYHINVWVWAEGQSAACTNSIAIAGQNLGGFTFGTAQSPITLS